jgi:hypothetical protein
MNDFSFRMIADASLAPLAQVGARGKIFRSFIPVSLDSDERIQGNPRKSKAPKSGLLQRNGRGPRKSKQANLAGL